MKKLKKDAYHLTTTGMVLGAGSVALGSMGGGAHLSGMTGMMPAIGAVSGASATMRLMGGMKPKKKRKKK